VAVREAPSKFWFELTSCVMKRAAGIAFTLCVHLSQ